SGPRIFVIAARPPLAATRISRGFWPALHLVRLLRTFPQPSARKPFERDVRVGALKLVKGRQQLGFVARAECRGPFVDKDRPVRVARRHSSNCTGIPGARSRDSTRDRVEA